MAKQLYVVVEVVTALTCWLGLLLTGSNCSKVEIIYLCVHVGQDRFMLGKLAHLWDGAGGWGQGSWGWTL